MVGVNGEYCLPSDNVINHVVTKFLIRIGKGGAHRPNSLCLKTWDLAPKLVWGRGTMLSKLALHPHNPDFDMMY